VTHVLASRSLSPLVGFVAALALIVAAVLAGMLTTAGHDSAGASWNKSNQAGASWNSQTLAGASWNKISGNGASWN
jgi:archaellum component FlaG (FlaF/FlaG flagellin family)